MKAYPGINNPVTLWWGSRRVDSYFLDKVDSYFLDNEQHRKMFTQFGKTGFPRAKIILVKLMIRWSFTMPRPRPSVV